MNYIGMIWRMVKMSQVVKLGRNVLKSEAEMTQICLLWSSVVPASQWRIGDSSLKNPYVQLVTKSST